VVVCDRFSDSTFAYQGGGQGLALPVLAQLERWVQAATDAPDAPILQPDLTLWFDLPPLEAARRLEQARAPDRFEARGADFFARVRQGYADRAQADPLRFVSIDAAVQREQVWQQVADAVRMRGWLP
jgi:dTMP kinase